MNPMIWEKPHRIEGSGSINLERAVDPVHEDPTREEADRACCEENVSHLNYTIAIGRKDGGGPNSPLITNHKKLISAEYPRYSNPPVSVLKLSIRAQ